MNTRKAGGESSHLLPPLLTWPKRNATHPVRVVPRAPEGDGRGLRVARATRSAEHHMHTSALPCAWLAVLAAGHSSADSP